MNLRSELFKKFLDAGKNLRSSILERDKQSFFDISFWATLGEIGIHEVLTGQGGTHARAATAFYGLAFGSLDLPFCMSLGAHALVFSDIFFAFANEVQCNEFADGIQSGHVIGAVCNSEKGAGTNLKNIQSTAVQIDSNTVVLNIVKPCSTNLPVAGLILVSAVLEKLNGEKSMAHFLLRGDEVEKVNISEKMMGFKTGSTGAFSVTNLRISLADRGFAIGKSAEVLKRCFNLERLYIGVITCGILHGYENEFTSQLQQKKSLAEKQYMQDKLVQICSVRMKMQGILQTVIPIIDANEFGIYEIGNEMSVLKIISNEECFAAGKAYLDAIGGHALLDDHSAQKFVRDLAVLAYFGGTTELQKISLFHDLTRIHKLDLKKCA